MKVTGEMLDIAMTEWHKVVEPRSEAMKAALEAVFAVQRDRPIDIEKEVHQPSYNAGWADCLEVGQSTDTQDNDGWIDWRKPYRPDLPIETKIELWFYNGDIEKAFVGGNWIWQNVIAYRIIEEPKEEKKQTLLEYAAVYPLYNLTTLEVINLISEYLELTNK